MTTPTKIEAYLPAEAVAVRPDLMPGVNIDAMTATINHVQGAITAVEVLLGEACEDRPSDHVLSAMLAGVETQLAVLTALCNHAHVTSEPKAGEDE
ncbi:hypothetical protein R5R73_07380 [Salinicola sp. LHM]|uniref:hypothetical protein n=1 Tax=unclassified Salinicola TaxID=2634022 RepID=UPI0008DD92F5|nr:MULTISPECIES: hypothetical protein [unclassified Salinicola]OHZ02877.1 hypothetical protein BC443_14335 [Salinicola sp. MIT1003]WQH34502.1 hypothetical protein R5R73_07380 [Salinicola sp. LHM]